MAQPCLTRQQRLQLLAPRPPRASAGCGSPFSRACASLAASLQSLSLSVVSSLAFEKSPLRHADACCWLAGTKGTGKTTLVRRVASTTGETLDTLESSGDSRRGRGVTSRQQKGQQQAQHAAARPPTLDLGLSYASLDVHDEDSGDDGAAHAWPKKRSVLN